MARYNTPLRYPGGKQKLTPFVVDVINYNGLDGCRYVEPYAGGAGVAIELLMNEVVGSIFLNDYTYPVYAFWKVVKENTDDLCERIRSASLTIDEWLKRREVIRNYKDYSIEEVAFSLFYMNRCNRSGVVGGGVIGGLKQTGEWKIDARFSRNDLISRIERISKRADQIEIANMDAETFIKSQSEIFAEETLIYYDPPYINRSARLYLNDYLPNDHERLANSIQQDTQATWMVSYDYDERIEEYYAARKQFTYLLQYNAAKAYKGKELFIFSDNLSIPERSNFRPINDVLNPPPIQPLLL